MPDLTKFECWVRIQDCFGFPPDEQRFKRIMVEHLREQGDVFVLELRDFKFIEQWGEPSGEVVALDPEYYSTEQPPTPQENPNE